MHAITGMAVALAAAAIASLPNILRYRHEAREQAAAEAAEALLPPGSFAP
jgi:hypothetical protein